MADSLVPDENACVSVWPEGDALDVELLDEILARGGRWSHGPVASVRARPVGGDFGFSGRVSRLSLTLDGGHRRSLVAKLEGAWWATREWDADRWADHLGRAAARYPEQIDERVRARCSSFHDETAGAHDVVVAGPRSWIHHDPHLDNVLWRADGRPVLLDWSGADVLPPSLDVAMLMQSLSFRPDPALAPGELLSVYHRELAEGGVDIDRAEVTVPVAAALRLLVRGLIGWAGSEPDPPPTARMLALRDAAPGRARAALEWIDAR